MTAPLKVAVVCFPSLGGSGVVATAQAVGLAARGHRVHVVAREEPGRLPQGCERLSFHRVPLPEYPLFESPPYTVALASTLLELAKSHALDVIHVHYAVPHAASAYLARQALGAGAPRVVASLHGTDVTRVGSHPAYRGVTAFAVAQADGLVVPSEFLRAEARRLLELPDAVPLEVLPNFVDVERFRPEAPSGPRAEPVLFHVSNFRPVKRVTDVLEVLARVRRQLPARLVMVGDGPERLSAEERARTLGLAPHVTFQGWRSDFARELAKADAFLLPSETESFGVAALESLSAGVPVFGYRVGGLPELVTNDVGRLVEPFDVDALAAALVAVLERPEAHARLREAARARVLASYRAEPALDRYEAFLRRVLSRPQAGAQ